MSSFDKKLLESFPKDSGVYVMKDAQGIVIYVGKAKNIKQRVKQYFVPGRDGRAMVPFLTGSIAAIDTIVVSSEKEALLLENTLIKRHLPKYNALLKDDKTFISLMVNNKHPWPMLKIVRYKGKPKKDGLYFGPYTSAFAARQTLDLLTKLFPLRQCSDEELKRRSRPCILYSIKRCIAPCVAKCTKAEYDTFVQGAIDFLQGEDKKIVQEMRAAMERAAGALEFEKAAALLQTIRQIEHVIEGGSVVARPRGKDSDAFGIYRHGLSAVLVQLFFREGKLIGSEHYSFDPVAETDEELLGSFLLQLYKERKHIPDEIIVPIKLGDSAAIGEILSTSVIYPQKGEKKELMTLAMRNAKAEFFKSKDAEELKERILLDMQEKLHLSRYPERIECFDTSNISGSDCVASMVAFTNGEKESKRSRLFKIRSIAKSDDYGALREALLRRLSRAKEENDLPDLVLVDGGKGQLNIAKDVLANLDIATVDIAAVAKEESKHTKGMTLEKVFVVESLEPIVLHERSPILFLLQRIRDEAHRRAIGFHHKRREKRVIQSALDDIAGIGPVKKKRLLRRFKSTSAIFQASEEELLQVEGIGPKEIAALKLLQSRLGKPL